ncbi:hypothetical protein LTR08_005618 [Meristemomyces frigidus]|nr:hypothetical protein LTR08_005618 [Meristemomyces frigidus]
MSSNFEKSVKGGTKVKLAPPKSKYVEHILLATQSGEAGVAEIFRTLVHRLRDSTWTVAFKSLIIVHLMIKEGAKDATLSYLAVAPKNRLAINTFTDVQTQGQNIRCYSEYLLARAQAFAVTQCDYVRNGSGRLQRMSVDKGLLRETEVVQAQIKALVKCDLLSNDVENEITLTAFRLLTRDLLDLYNVENEAVMNVLSHYFEMSRPDAERAIKIYRAFCKQTDLVVQYLSTARQYEHATRLEIPKIKHAPTMLVNSLQDYLDDNNFEVNRRQYLAEQEGKRTGKSAQSRSLQPKLSKASAAASAATQPIAASQNKVDAVMSQPAAKGPAPDLIDFFGSIEQNQQPMAQNASQQFQAQPTGFPMQTQQTGFPTAQQQQPQQPAEHPMQAQQTGFPTAQQQPQQAFGFPQAPQQTGMNGLPMDGASTNPFGQPHQQQQQPQPLQAQFTGAGFGGYGPQPPQQQQPFQSGNAFAQQAQNMFASPAQSQSPVQMQPLQSIQPQPTESTNPFRQSTMPTGASTAFSTPPFAQQGLPQRQNTNPFARNISPAAAVPNAFAAPAPQQQQQQQPSPFPPEQPQVLQAQPTGTNPFARAVAQQPTAQMPPQSALQVQQTGTNPFRQSAFVNQQTGAGWQNAGPQATIGGLANVETIPVFPRPGQMAPQQAQQQSPWG